MNAPSETPPKIGQQGEGASPSKAETGIDTEEIMSENNY
jgi:hypothetical protein